MGPRFECSSFLGSTVYIVPFYKKKMGQNQNGTTLKPLCSEVILETIGSTLERSQMLDRMVGSHWMDTS